MSAAVKVQAGVALMAFGIVALMHSNLGRSVAKGSCPLGFDAKRSVAEKESERQRFTVLHRAEHRAAMRPALGFVLDVTTRTDIRQWAAQHHLSCVDRDVGPDVECVDVP